MRAVDFKTRFLQISIEDRETAISEMKKADVAQDHMEGIEHSKQPEMIDAFQKLIEWCESNKKLN